MRLNILCPNLYFSDATWLFYVKSRNAKGHQNVGRVHADDFADVPLGTSQLRPPARGNGGASTGTAAATVAGSSPRSAPRSVSLAQHVDSRRPSPPSYATATATVTLAGAGKPGRLCLVGLACMLGNAANRSSTTDCLGQGRTINMGSRMSCVALPCDTVHSRILLSLDCPRLAYCCG